MPSLWNRIRQSSTIRVGAALVGGQAVSSAIGIVCSLIQVRFVSPSQMGMLQSCAILTSYLSFLHLGTFTALQRELPYLIGKGEVEKAKQLASVCQGWVMLSAVVSSMVFLVAAFWSAWHGDYPIAAGWLVQAVGIALILYTGYLTVTYRTSSEFVVLAKNTAKSSFFSAVTLPLLVVNAYYGMCLRNTLNSCVNGLLLHIHRPLHVKPSLHWKSLKGLISFGLPLSVFGYVETSMWVATQNFFVFRALGRETLGLLAFTLAAQTAVLIVPQSINQIYMPRIAQEFGSCHDLRRVIRLCIKPTAVSFTLSCMAVLAAWFCVGPACRLLAPKYVAAIPAVQWMLFIMPLVSLRLPQYILIASRRRRAYALSTMVGFSVGIGLLLLVLAANGGLASVVRAYQGGYLAMIAASLIQIAWASGRDRAKKVDEPSATLSPSEESADAATS